MSKERARTLIQSVADLIRAVTGFLVVLILLAGAGWFVVGRFSRDDEKLPSPVRSKPVPKPVDWSQVDAEIEASLKNARAVAEAYASDELDLWVAGLMRRVDSDFLGWFFGYFNQQVLGAKGLWYGAAHWWDNGRPSASAQLNATFQAEFSKRVLRPQIAQLQIERIAERTVSVYAESLRTSLAVIPEKYEIPMPDWERHLNDLALIAGSAEGNRKVALTMKAFTVSTAFSAVVLGKLVHSGFRRVGRRLSAKATGKLASRAAGKMAAKAGGKMGARLGGKFLGPLIGAGIVAWDLYDHHRTKKIEKPVLRRNIEDYLAETKHVLLHDTGTGVLSAVHEIEEGVLQSLQQVASAEDGPRSG